MKRAAIAALLAGVSNFALGVCTYPLDATADQYAQAGLPAYPYINFQTAYGPVTTNSYFFAASDTGAAALLNAAETGVPAGDIALPTSGIVALEYILDYSLTSVSPVGQALSNVALRSGTYAADGSTEGFEFGLIYWHGSVNNFKGVIPVFNVSSGGTGSSNVQPFVPLNPPLAGVRVGIYFNGTTRQVGYIVDGQDYGYVPNLTVPTSVQSVAISLHSDVGLLEGDPNIGGLIGGSLVVDSAQFTQPFPAGSTDICSTSGGITLPSGKPYPGKGNPPGLQRIRPLQFQGLPALKKQRP